MHEEPQEFPSVFFVMPFMATVRYTAQNALNYWAWALSFQGPQLRSVGLATCSSSSQVPD